MNINENQVEGLTFSDLALEVTTPHCPYTPLVRVVSRCTQIQGEGMRPSLRESRVRHTARRSCGMR